MLYVFLEGPDDERFFSKVMAALLGECHYVLYANMPNSKVNNYIKSIDQTPTSDYIFLVDGDGKSIEDRKSCIMSKYTKLSIEKVFVVQFEIESWYCAGASEDDCHKLKLRHFIFCTDNLTKEEFQSKLVRTSDKKYIMDSLLDIYSLQYAVTRNHSLMIFTQAVYEKAYSAVS